MGIGFRDDGRLRRCSGNKSTCSRKRYEVPSICTTIARCDNRSSNAAAITLSSNTSPQFAEASVGSQDNRATLIAGVDKLEEPIAAVRADGQVTDLIEDEQAITREEANGLCQVALALGLGHRTHDLSELSRSRRFFQRPRLQPPALWTSAIYPCRVAPGSERSGVVR